MQTFPKPLTPGEERACLERLQEGDREARDILIERNLRLVAHVAKKYQGTDYETEDLLSVGTIGLIKAVGTYQPAKNIKLATYASRCIENEILMHMRKISNQKAEVSLDEPINLDGEGNELLLSDILGTGEEDILAPLEAAADLAMLRQSLLELSAREREIVDMRYGLGGGQELTQKEVADLLGISQSYISRLEKKIMKRLKKELLKESA